MRLSGAPIACPVDAEGCSDTSDLALFGGVDAVMAVALIALAVLAVLIAALLIRRRRR